MSYIEVLDQTLDLSGREQHRLTSLYPPPAFVKSASHERLYGAPETTPTHAYAEPVRRLYPCHTAPATWMSACFFYDKRAAWPADKAELIEKRLLAAADFHAIRGDVDQLRTKIAATVGDDLTKLADDSFAIIWQFENGERERHWPLRNAKEVQFAAGHFAKHRDKFAFADRHRVATRILEKAGEFGAHLGGHDDCLEKAAGQGGCSARDAADMCAQRAKLTKRAFPELSAELEGIADIIRANPTNARGHENLVKLATVVDAFDRETKLNKYYGEGGLARPEEVLFQVTEKAARKFVEAHVETTTGNTYAVGDLEKISAEHFRQWLGDDFVSAVTIGDVLIDGAKLASVVPTLDRGAATLFDRMAAAAHVPPVLQDKEAGDRLGSQELISLAAKYRPQVLTGSVL